MKKIKIKVIGLSSAFDRCFHFLAKLRKFFGVGLRATEAGTLIMLREVGYLTVNASILDRAQEILRRLRGLLFHAPLAQHPAHALIPNTSSSAGCSGRPARQPHLPQIMVQ